MKRQFIMKSMIPWVGLDRLLLAGGIAAAQSQAPDTGSLRLRPASAPMGKSRWTWSTHSMPPRR